MSPHNIDPALEKRALLQPVSGDGKNGSPLESRVQEAETEEMNYKPVPPRKTVTLTVRCHVRGRGQPLPYLLNEGDGQ